MHDWRWAFGGVVTLAALGLCASSTTPAAPILAGRDLGPELRALEATVSRHPADRAALETLAEAYLAGGAPGLAVAAIDRAPEQVRAAVHVADARARALTELGRPEAALAAQRRVLESCERASCSPNLVARAERRARWLGELVRQGIDPLAEPERTLLAYRIAAREVRLDGP